MTTGSQQPADPAARLSFDDPLSLRSADDTDSGWGEGPGGTSRAAEAQGEGSGSRGGQSANTADLARFLEEKPPHHL